MAKCRIALISTGGTIEKTYDALASCDTVLVVGTSGMVHPAAGFPAIAKQGGARVIEVNPEETPITRDADISLHGSAGEVLPQIVLSLEAHSSKGT